MSKPGSAGSLRAAVLPFGQLVFSSLEPFNVSSVLDVWLKGSVVSNAHLAFESSSARRSSEPVSLVSLTSGASEADVETASVARALGPDDDGWWRVLVNLPALLVGSGEGGDAVLSDLLGPSPSSKGVEGVGWDRMVFLDASGGGFEVAMEDAWLRPILGAAPSIEDCDKCYSKLSIEASIERVMVPLYGAGELGADGDEPTDLVARLAPNITTSELAALCKELESQSSNTRFNGACKGEEMDVQAANVTPDAPVEWPFLALTAASPADLKSLRTTLVGQIEYFDIDQTARIFNSKSIVGDPSTVPAPADSPYGLEIATMFGADGMDPPTALDGNYSSLLERLKAELEGTPSIPSKATSDSTKSMPSGNDSSISALSCPTVPWQ